MKEWLKDLYVRVKEDMVKAHKSLTIWFNGIIGMLIVALPTAQDSFPALQEYIPENLYHYGMGLLIVGNMLLRFRTSTRLAAK